MMGLLLSCSRGEPVKMTHIYIHGPFSQSCPSRAHTGLAPRINIVPTGYMKGADPLLSVPERAHYILSTGLIILPFLLCFFDYSSRSFGQTYTKRYQNVRLCRGKCAKTFLRFSGNGLPKNRQKMNGCVLVEFSQATVGDIIARVKREKKLSKNKFVNCCWGHKCHSTEIIYT